MLCDYGCGFEAKFTVGKRNLKSCCKENFHQCPGYRGRTYGAIQRQWDLKRSDTKLCPKCTKTKSTDEFHSNQNGHPASWCKACTRTGFDTWAILNPEKSKESRRKAQLTENQRAIKRNYEYRLREAAVAELGGVCVTCGWNDPRALHIDHIAGGGSKEKKSSKSKTRVYREVIAGVEGKYQLLCANHNTIKKYENGEGVSIHHPLRSR